MSEQKLNPDGIEAAKNTFVFMCADGFTPKDEDLVESIVSAYLAVAQPEVTPLELANAWEEGHRVGADDTWNRPYSKPTPNPYRPEENNA